MSERLDSATACLLIELGFLVPRGTSFKPDSPLGKRLQVFKDAIEADAIAPLLIQLDAANQWKEAIIEASVVNWTYRKEHETNPRLAIADLIACVHREATDPFLQQLRKDTE